MKTLHYNYFRGIAILLICVFVMGPYPVLSQEATSTESSTHMENDAESSSEEHDESTEETVSAEESSEEDVVTDEASENEEENTDTEEDTLLATTSEDDEQADEITESATTTSDGTSGTTQATTTDDDPTVVVSGDAESTTSVDNAVNTTEVSATTTGTSTVAATTTSDAEVHNTGTTTANTGENVASSTERAVVQTGDAVAAHEFVNLINTTIYNSEGFLFLLNMLFGNGTFDLRDLDFESFVNDATDTANGTQEIGCSLEGCSDPNVSYSITSSSTATVTNSHIIRANTGGNTASGNDAEIYTGDAYAFANGINVANSNFIDSRYLLVSVNNIGSYLGDLVLPSAQFFSQFLTNAPTVTRSDYVAVDNNADVTNTVTAEADTGNNTASTTDAGEVSTGNSCAFVNLDNRVNENYIGTSMVNILVRVSGDWSGEIFGLPDGLLWERTSQGIRIYNTDTATSSAATSAAHSTTSVTNKAYINNDITVSALTGDNEVAGGDGLIETGDACVAANIQNVANTNVIGSNWMSAFFNILGDFEGNIAFGRPDLWIGGVAELSGEYARAGSDLQYTYTIVNNGDAPAQDVSLVQDVDGRLHSIRSADVTRMSTSSDQWMIGDLAPGESVEVSYTATVEENIPYGLTPLALSATVDAYEPDNNDTDNTEELTVMAFRQSSGSSGGSRNSSDGDDENPDITVQKWVGTSTELTIDEQLGSGATSTPVRYTVSVTNDGGPAYDATLHDVITDAAGDVINEQSWQLGTIQAGETINVSYTVSFTAELGDGVYTNNAWIEAYETDESGSRANDDNDRLDIHRSSAVVTLARTPLQIENVTANATGEFAAASSAQVTWQTNRPADTRVVYGPAGTTDFNTTNPQFGYQSQVSIPDDTTDHTVTLTGLTPGTEYVFRALSYRDDTYALSGEGRFVVTGGGIAMPEPTDGEFVFAEDTDATTTDPTGQVLGTTTASVDSLAFLRPTIAYAQTSETTGSVDFCTETRAIPLALLLAFITFCGWALWVYRSITDAHHQERFAVRNGGFITLFILAVFVMSIMTTLCTTWPVLVVILALWFGREYIATWDWTHGVYD